MVEAMALVRAELGADALILGTRRLADGAEVTAALDDVAPPPPPVQAMPARVPADPGRVAALSWHRLPDDLVEKLAFGPLDVALAARFDFQPVALAPGAAPLLLAGPPGAGKTLTTARLAARLVMAGARPMVVTADGKRAGATEQLAAFTRLLGLHLLVASSPVALARALQRRGDGAPVLIDTPGFDLFDPAQSDELASLATTADGAIVLVLPAGIDAAEAADIAAAHREIGAARLVANRLDGARRLGGVLAAADAGLALAEAGIGPGVADGLVPLTPELLGARLLQGPDRLT